MTEKKPEMGVAEVPRASLLAKFGARYSVAPAKVYETLMKTAFKEAQNPEQVMALLVVADQYGLNPFTKEIYAFPDAKTGAVIPVVGVDGWNRIAQQHEQYDGVEFNYADDMVESEDGRPCPEWVEVIIYRKDRTHPVILREYLDECYKPIGKYPDGNKHKPGPWQTHTKRMLRHKALIQGYRTAFGFHGIYDPDEAENFIDVESRNMQPPSDGRQTRKGPEPIEKALAAPAAQEHEKQDGGKAKTPVVDSGADDAPDSEDDLGGV